MVLESVAAFFLDKYLGDYFEDLDSHQLKIDLWHGNVSLEHVYLKPKSLAHLNVPLRIVSAYLEKLTIHIPWKHFHSDRTRIELDGFYLLLSASSELVFDREKDEKEEQEKKMNELKKVEEFREERERARKGHKASEEKETFVDRLKLHFLRNLEVSISNIHLSYEDPLSEPSHPFAFGLLLKSLRLTRTNDQWEHVASDDHSSIVYKFGEISHFSIYWNSNIEQRTNLNEETILNELKRPLMIDSSSGGEKTTSRSSLCYIVEPVNVRSRLEMGKRSKGEALARGDIDLDPVSVNIHRNQYSDLLDFLEFQDNYKMKRRSLRYSSWHLDPATKKSSSQRWKFAFEVIVHERVRPRLNAFRWTSIHENLRRVKEYREIYARQLNEKMSKEDKQTLESLEKDIPLFNLISIRRMAQLQAKKIHVNEAKEKKPNSWWTSLHHWWHSEKEGRTTDGDSADVEGIDDEEIPSDDQDLPYPREYVDFDLSLRLPSMELNVYSSEDHRPSGWKCIASVQLSKSLLTLQRRPAKNDLSILLDLSSLSLSGHGSSISAGERPFLVQRFDPSVVGEGEEQQRASLFHLEFDSHPLSSEADYRLQAHSQPLQLTYHAETINELFRCFLPARQHDLQAIKEAAYSIYTDIKHRTQFLLSENLKKIRDVDIDVDLQSIYFLLPDKGSSDKSSSMVCVDFGQLTMKDLRRHAEINHHETFEDAQNAIDPSSDLLYLPMKVQLTKLQILILNRNEQWQSVRLQEDSPSHLFRPVHISWEIYKLICLRQSTLPIWKMEVEVKPVECHGAENRLLTLARVIQSIPLPETQQPNQKEQVKDDTHRTSTKETYESIEKSTPIKKLAQAEEEEQEEGDEQGEEHDERVQVDFNFKVRQIDVFVEKSLTEWSDLREKFFSFTSGLLVAQVKVKRFDVEWNVALKSLTINHDEFIREMNQPLCLFVNEGNDNLINATGLLTSPSNPAFDSPRYRSIETQVSLKIGRCQSSLQLESLFSLFQFVHQFREEYPHRDQKDATPPPPPTPAESPSSKRATMEIDVTFQGISLLIGNELRQMLLVQLDDVQLRLSRLQRSDALRVLLHRFDVLHSTSPSTMEYLIKNQGSADTPLLLIDVLFVDLSHSRQATPRDDQRSHVKVRWQKMQLILLYKYVDLLLNLLRLFQSSSNATSSSSSPSLLTSLEEKALAVDIDLFVDLPVVLLPLDSQSNEKLRLDLGQITNEQHRILLSNVRVDRVDEQETCLVHCSPVDIALDDHFHSVNIQWEFVEVQLNPHDYTFLKRLANGNFRESVCPKMVPVKREAKSRPVTDAQATRTPTKEPTADVQLQFQFELKRVTMSMSFDGGQGTTTNVSVLEIQQIQLSFDQKNSSECQGEMKVHSFSLEDLAEVHLSTPRVDDQHNAPTLLLQLQSENNARRVHGHLTNLSVCLSSMLITSLRDLLGEKPQDNLVPLPSPDSSPCHRSSLIELSLPRPARFVGQSTGPLLPTKQSSSSPPPAAAASGRAEMELDFHVRSSQILLRESDTSNGLAIEFSVEVKWTDKDSTRKMSSSIDDLTVYLFNAEQKQSSSSLKYQVLEPTTLDVVLLIVDGQTKKIDVRLSDVSMHVNPILLQMINSFVKSTDKGQADGSDDDETKDTRDLRSIFIAQPLEHSSFLFLQNDGTINTRDLLEENTGREGAETNEDENEKTSTTNAVREQLMVSLKLMEVKLEMSQGSTSKGLLAICLSNVFGDVQNWSSGINVGASLSIELALFNDHLLAWEPLIEPIIDQRGEVLSPWSIVCQTKLSGHEKDDDDDEKRLISIRSDHLFNVTITKTTIDLFQYLAKMFGEKEKKETLRSTEDNEQSILSLDNETGVDLRLVHLHCLQLINGTSLDKGREWKHGQSIALTVPNERLSATHFPLIAEEIGKRKQEFTVEIEGEEKKMDINQTWRRVYRVSPSLISQWPREMLCNSEIVDDRRRILLSSIVKVFNHTERSLFVFDADAIEKNQWERSIRIEPNKESSLPMDFLYGRATSRLYFGVEQDQVTSKAVEFISFDWINETSSDRFLKLANGQSMAFVINKETVDSYSENTDEPLRSSFDLYVQWPVHVTNLLPIAVQCSIDDVEQVLLQPSDLHHSPSAHKKSRLRFLIPAYNNAQWLSEEIDLDGKGQKGHDEHLLEFHDAITGESLRLVVRVDNSRQSLRLSLFCPYWLVNGTDLKLEFKIDSDKTFVNVVDQPYLICPKKYSSDSKKKKGHIRVFSIEEDESRSKWSDAFSIDVIKSKGATTCRVANDRTYMISIDISTCSFGWSKVVTIAASIIVMNKSSIDIELIENVEEDAWSLIKSKEMISYWPRQFREGLVSIRCASRGIVSRPFPVNEKSRRVIRWDDAEQPGVHVEIIATDTDGYRIIFNDYQLIDVPVLLINCLREQSISFAQENHIQSHVLPPQSYIYYTWDDHLKPEQLIVAAANGHKATLQLDPLCGVLGSDEDQLVYYSVFPDDLQTVILFSEEKSLIESVSGDMGGGRRHVDESMNEYIEILFHQMAISLIDDVHRQDLFYLTINPSKEIWTERNEFHTKAVSADLHRHLEENHKKYLKDPWTKEYPLDKHQSMIFDGQRAELTDDQGETTAVKRQSLDGFWLGCARSSTHLALHCRINHIQIDNQLQLTTFPTILHPIVSKASGTDQPGKAFVELSVLKDQSSKSQSIRFKYVKLLVQEFAVYADQSLILAILNLLKSHEDPLLRPVKMDTDLKRLNKPLQSMINEEKDGTASSSNLYFDEIHLSPLKIHVSFSMHGSEGSDQLLAQYPLVDFLLQILNVAEVQDVILKLNYYERKKDRFTMERLTKEISDHYEGQLLKQIHVVVLGLDVLGNPFGLIRGVAHGVESFFYEPYQGAMEGPMEFLQGIAKGSRHLVGSVIGGAAGAVAKVTGTASKGLATLTLDKDYQNLRIQRKELSSQSTSDLASTGKNTLKDVMNSVKGVVKKPIEGAKKGGGRGFFKGLGKGFLGLVARPTSGIADLTSTSFNLIKKVATHEEIVHRVRSARHVGRDGLIRPSIAHETCGLYLLNLFHGGKDEKTETYVAHITCSTDPPIYFFATTKRILLLTDGSSPSSPIELQWEYHYKDLKGSPLVKFDPNYIEVHLKESHGLGSTKKDENHVRVVPYDSLGEARYVVDQIAWTMHLLEL